MSKLYQLECNLIQDRKDGGKTINIGTNIFSFENKSAETLKKVKAIIHFQIENLNGNPELHHLIEHSILIDL